MSDSCGGVQAGGGNAAAPADAPAPVVMDLVSTPDDCAAWAASAALGEGVLTPFGVLDPAALSVSGNLDAIVALERLKAWVDAQQARHLARIVAHPGPLPIAGDGPDREFVEQEFIREEIACALRWSVGVTAERMTTATALVDRVPATLAGLEDGRYSYLHARALADAVRDLPDPITAKIEDRVLPRAPLQTLSEFRRSLRRAVLSLDPRGQAEKRAAAETDRKVTNSPGGGCQMKCVSGSLP